MKIPEREDKHERGISYMGVDWRVMLDPIPVKPKDSLLFSDLRGCRFDGLDLSLVKFIGCRLNAATFQRAILQETQFISCFSSDDAPPTDFRTGLWKDVLITDSHLNCLSDQKGSHFGRWPVEVAEAASGTLSERNDERAAAAAKLSALNYLPAAPLLACLLFDPEWDVRSVALKALRQVLHQNSTQQDRVLLDCIFLSLGDEHSLVRQEASELVNTLAPPDDVLRVSIDRIKSHSSEDQLAGLRAAVELCRSDESSSRLIDFKRIQSLLSSESPEIRGESLHLLGILDDLSTLSWLLAGLSDPAAAVRIAALSALRLLKKPPSASKVIPLMKDSDEDVRIEAIHTLGQSRDFDPQTLRGALTDPSTEVRRLAQELLKMH